MDGRAAGSEVWGTIVVNCLQKEVAILSSLVTCLLLKVLGWLRGIRCFLPDIWAMSLKRRPVSCVRWRDSTPVLQLLSIVFGYGFGYLFYQEFGLWGFWDFIV